MADDPFSKYAKKLAGTSPTASATPPFGEPQDTHDPESDGFLNKVRPVCIELRCHRSGLSYSMPYAHLGAIVFNFRTGKELSFTGAGLGVTIRGPDLSGIARALRLHSCSLIEDQTPGVESITIEPLRPLPQAAKVKTEEEA